MQAVLAAANAHRNEHDLWVRVTGPHGAVLKRSKVTVLTQRLVPEASPPAGALMHLYWIIFDAFLTNFPLLLPSDVNELDKGYKFFLLSCAAG